MASLTARAQAVCREAERSRARSVSLRAELRRQLRAGERHRARLLATVSGIEEGRYGRFCTAWSNLLWRRPTHDEENVLELIDH